MQAITLTLLGSALLAFPIAATEMLVSGPAPTTHEVKMVLEGNTGRFEPANLTVKPGDRVRFVTVSGPPHNVAFDPEKVPDDAEKQLAAGMPNPMSPLAGPLVMKAGESYTISLDGVKPGTYDFFCMPHVAMGMKGTLTVK